MGAAYCSPIREAVSRAIRILSVEPLIEGVPTHCAPAAMFVSFSPSALCAQKRSEIENVHTQVRMCMYARVYVRVCAHV